MTGSIPPTTDPAALGAGDDDGAVRAFYAATGVPDEIAAQIVGSDAWPAAVRGAPTLLAEIDLAPVSDAVLASVRRPVHLIVSTGSPDAITAMTARLTERLRPPVWREPGGWHGVDRGALSGRVQAMIAG